MPASISHHVRTCTSLPHQTYGNAALKRHKLVNMQCHTSSFSPPLPSQNAQVISIADGMPTWVYEVCAAKPTVREAIAFVKDIEAKAVLPIRPLPAAV
jgi:hypothetical protein